MEKRIYKVVKAHTVLYKAVSTREKEEVMLQLIEMFVDNTLYHRPLKFFVDDVLEYCNWEGRNAEGVPWEEVKQKYIDYNEKTQ